MGDVQGRIWVVVRFNDLVVRLVIPFEIHQGGITEGEDLEGTEEGA